MHKLMFMGQPGHVDDVRCRIYDSTGETECEAKRVAFVRACAGPGAIDCPAFDGFVAALQGRGWLPPTPDLEPNPDGPGKIGRWRLTDTGQREVEKILRGWE